MQYLTSITLGVVAIIHLLPMMGLLGVDRLESLYGVPIDDPNLAILMRHRAVLFGIVGSLLLYAAVVPQFQPHAFVVGYVSVLSFLVLAWSTGGGNSQIHRVVVADVVALVCLVIGSLAYGWRNIQAG